MIQDMRKKNNAHIAAPICSRKVPKDMAMMMMMMMTKMIQDNRLHMST